MINTKWRPPRGVIDGLIVAGTNCLDVHASNDVTLVDGWSPSEKPRQLPLKWVVLAAIF